MPQNEQSASAIGEWALATVLLNALVLKMGYLVHAHWYWTLLLTLPVMIQALIDVSRERRALNK